MIRYALKCDQDHTFESWFASASAYEALCKSGHVVCAHCGSARVEKALMAPAVSHVPNAAPAAPATQTPQQGPDEKLVALRRKIEANSDYVGADFVTEARAMHLGDAPERAIWGEARIDEAKALVDDGVPVMPLPFMPRSKTN